MRQYCTLLILVFMLCGNVSAQEQLDSSTEKAMIVLAEMGAHLSSLDSFKVQSHATFDEPMSGQLVEHSQITEVMASRTRGFRMNTRGDLMHSSAFFNGSDFVMYDRDRKLYAMAPFKGTLHELTDHAAKNLGVILPAAELMRKDPAEALLEDAETLFYVGFDLVDETPCHHVAARNKNGMEWELWVEDTTLLPRKILVRDATLPGSPRSVAVFSNWELNPVLPDMIFNFLIPSDAEQIEFRLTKNGGQK